MTDPQMAAFPGKWQGCLAARIMKGRPAQFSHTAKARVNPVFTVTTKSRYREQPSRVRNSFVSSMGRGVAEAPRQEPGAVHRAKA